MKILLGTHSVGKTTLLHEINNHFPDYFITDGFSRPAVRIGKKLDLYEDEVQTIINELTVWGYKNYLKHKKVISARSIIDAIVYTEILHPELDEQISDMTSVFQETVNLIEHIFYIPIEFDYVEDGERTHKEIQKKVDDVIVHFMNKNIPSDKIITITGTVEERFNKIKNYL